MIKQIFCFGLFLASLAIQAQNQQVKFNSMIAAGLLEGEAGTVFQVEAINGIRYKTLSAGIGAGLDYYNTRSIPLFLDVRKAFSDKPQTAFVYADGGYNFIWQTTAQKTYPEINTKGGLYYDFGIGYQLPVLKSSSLFFSAGYSEKDWWETSYYPYIIEPFSYPAIDYQKYKYTLRRISIKTGLRF